MLALSFCGANPGHLQDYCDRAKYESALRAADPQNALAWLGALAAPNADRQVVLANMAGSARFDFYRGEIESLLLRAVNAAPVLPPSTADQGMIASAQRRRQWQMHHLVRLRRSADQNRRWLQDRGSTEVAEELLLENGIPLDPPPDWTPGTSN
jgi:hypothetical protein